MIKDLKQKEQYYDALVKKDKQYVGIFYVGVKTTGIFCIATCSARKPKFVNVEFYKDLKEVLQDGFRPCKVCKPTEHSNEPPADILTAMELLKQTPKEKVQDWQLREKGLSPEKIRRWFQKNYGITFHGYQRMLRINTAFQELKNGKTVTDSAFDSSYESLSGFAYTFKKIIGKSPSKSSASSIILIKRFNTVLGPMFCCATDDGICLLEFVDRRMLETEFKDLQRLRKAKILIGSNAHLKQMEKELTEYFKGLRQNFEVALDLPGTEFQRSVWTALQDIPYGTTRSYQAQAVHLKKPKAVRAVARANGYNRVSIVVPCHRVIGKNGDLTGYGGGLDRKRWLLEHEAKNKIKASQKVLEI